MVKKKKVQKVKADIEFWDQVAVLNKQLREDSLIGWFRSKNMGKMKGPAFWLSYL